MIRCPRCKSHLSPWLALPLGKKKQTTSFKSSRPTTSPHPSSLKSTKNRISSIPKSHRDYTIWKYFVDKLTLILSPREVRSDWTNLHSLRSTSSLSREVSENDSDEREPPFWPPLLACWSPLRSLGTRVENRSLIGATVKQRRERVSCTDMLSQLFARLQSVNKLTVVKLFTDWKEIKEASWTWALSNQVEPPWSSFSDLENVTYCSNFTPSSYNFE